MRSWRCFKAKGFTLVELLVVIIIIGVLAGMFVMTSGSATDKADFAREIANLRMQKAAVLLYYADNGHWPPIPDEGWSFDYPAIQASLDKYIDGNCSLKYAYGNDDNEKLNGIVLYNIGKEHFIVGAIKVYNNPYMSESIKKMFTSPENIEKYRFVSYLGNLFPNDDGEHFYIPVNWAPAN